MNWAKLKDYFLWGHSFAVREAAGRGALGEEAARVPLVIVRRIEVSDETPIIVIPEGGHRPRSWYDKHGVDMVCPKGHRLPNTPDARLSSFDWPAKLESVGLWCDICGCVVYQFVVRLAGWYPSKAAWLEAIEASAIENGWQMQVPPAPSGEEGDDVAYFGAPPFSELVFDMGMKGDGMTPQTGDPRRWRVAWVRPWEDLNFGGRFDYGLAVLLERHKTLQELQSGIEPEALETRLITFSAYTSDLTDEERLAVNVGLMLWPVYERAALRVAEKEESCSDTGI